MLALTVQEIEHLFQSAAGADEETHLRFARAIEGELRAKLKRTDARLRKFLDAAAGEGLELDGVDAAELFTEVCATSTPGDVVALGGEKGEAAK